MAEKNIPDMTQAAPAGAQVLHKVQVLVAFNAPKDLKVPITKDAPRRTYTRGDVLEMIPEVYMAISKMGNHFIKELK